MRLTITILLGLLPALLLGQESGDNSTRAFIKQLGSANFQERQAATKALKMRPEAVPALRELLRSGDLEYRRRAAEILDYHERRPLRELHAAVKDGRVDHAIELLAAWPKGKYESEVWQAVRELVHRLEDLNEKQGGKKIDSWIFRAAMVPVVVSAKRVSEATKTENTVAYFLGAEEIDVDPSRTRNGQLRTLFPESVMVSSGRTRTISEPACTPIILSGSSVELTGICTNALVVSCTDVTVKGDLANSLVIARGNVVCTGSVKNSRIIAGNSIKYNKKARRDCIISENDLNPLGFIRWADAPKNPAAPKGK